MTKMKQFTLLTLFFIALATLNADTQTKDAAPANPGNPANEIRDWLDRWTKAFAKQDVDAIMALYADDVIAYDIVPPLQYIGKDAYRADYQQFFSQYEGNLHVEVRDLHVNATGDLGYAAGLELISGTLKSGQKSSIWLRFTSLFRKLDGHWLDFHDHVSVPADIETGKAMLDLKP
jgi:uncharacterized protein (TIGR02246 family)